LRSLSLRGEPDVARPQPVLGVGGGSGGDAGEGGDEACDDGNWLDGDGRDKGYRVEPGYEYSDKIVVYEKSPDTGECVQRISIVHRDFFFGSFRFVSLLGDYGWDLGAADRS